MSDRARPRIGVKVAEQLGDVWGGMEGMLADRLPAGLDRDRLAGARRREET
jgi:hypothetical protein